MLNMPMAVVPSKVDLLPFKMMKDAELTTDTLGTSRSNSPSETEADESIRPEDEAEMTLVDHFTVNVLLAR